MFVITHLVGYTIEVLNTAVCEGNNLHRFTSIIDDVSA